MRMFGRVHFDSVLKLKDLTNNVLHGLTTGNIVNAHANHDVTRLSVIVVIPSERTLSILEGATNYGLYIKAATRFEFGVFPAPVECTGSDEDFPSGRPFHGVHLPANSAQGGGFLPFI